MHECDKHLVPAFGFRWCYAELKDRLAAGTPLSREELDFIGAYERRRSSDGWRSAAGIASEDDEISAETTAILRALVSRDRLEFLG